MGRGGGGGAGCGNTRVTGAGRACRIKDLNGGLRSGLLHPLYSWRITCQGTLEWIASGGGGRAASAAELVGQPRRAGCRHRGTRLSAEPVCAPRHCSVLGISHLLLLLLKREGAEEQGEGRVEPFPCAHLAQWHSGTHTPETHIRGHTHTPPAASWGLGAPGTPAAPLCLVLEADTGFRGGRGRGVLSPERERCPNGAQIACLRWVQRAPQSSPGSQGGPGRGLSLPAFPSEVLPPSDFREGRTRVAALWEGEVSLLRMGRNRT